MDTTSQIEEQKPQKTEIEQFELNQAEVSTEAVKIRGIIEAILFATSEPVTVGQLHFFLKENFLINKKGIEKLLSEIKEDYTTAGRSFELVDVAGGYQLRTKTEYSAEIKRFLKISGHEKLSKASLETLAIIAYKQPISRAEIEKIRGVNIDGVMRILLEKELIYASGQKEVPGKPWLYSTTKNFLVTFGLKSIQELPPIGELNLN